jgi:hypothetical protein
VDASDRPSSPARQGASASSVRSVAVAYCARRRGGEHGRTPARSGWLAPSSVLRLTCREYSSSSTSSLPRLRPRGEGADWQLQERRHGLSAQRRPGPAPAEDRRSGTDTHARRADVRIVKGVTISEKRYQPPKRNSDRSLARASETAKLRAAQDGFAAFTRV